MTTAVLTPPTPVGSSRVPRPLRWTCDQFHQLGESGRLEGRRALLIDGVILEQGPMNPPHAISLELVVERLRQVFAIDWRIRVQMPLVLSLYTDPEPDVAVLPGNPRDALIHPTTASLLVEVSDTTLAFDLGDKSNLYAAGGIADYWVVDLVNHQVHAFRDPQADPNTLTGFRYRQKQTFDSTETISPLAMPNAVIPVADLLP